MEEETYGEVEKVYMGHNWLWVPATRRKERGRASGGIVMGIRKGITYKNFTFNKTGSWASVDCWANNTWNRIIGIYNNTSINVMEKELRKLCNTDMNIWMGGDLNARIGILGAKDGERSTQDTVQNEEGEKWVEMATAMGLSVLNGNTSGDWIGHFTRIGYDNQESSVIDYTFASEKAEIATENFTIGSQTASDHFPLELTCNVINKGTQTKCKIVQVWNAEGKAKFKQRLQPGTAGEGWPNTHARLANATERRVIKLGTEARCKWWNQDCYTKRKELREALKRLRQSPERSTNEYKIKRSQYKKAIQIAKEAEKTRLETELRRIKNISEGWRFISRTGPTKTFTTNRPSDNNFKEHFQQLLGGDERTEPTVTTSTEAPPLITQEEFLREILRMKQKKAVGPDGLKAEAIIHSDLSTKQQIRRQLNEVLEGGSIPESWGESQIWPIFKKGDYNDPNNYRGIAIGNAIHKLLANILQSRLRKFAEENGLLPDSQNGFREGRSTIDSIYILNSLIHTTISKPKGKMYALFVDFRTAFDTINRGILWKTLEKIQVPSYMLDTLKRMYGNVTYRVGEHVFKSHTGLKQGCPLSPLLFALYIAGLEESLKRNQLGGVMLGRKKVYSLAFADDLVLVAKSEDEMKDMIRALHRFAKNKCLTVNQNKSKILTFSKGARGSKTTWTVDGSSYEEVEEFTYLGVTLQRNGSYIRHKKMTAAKARIRAAQVWSSAERLFPNNFEIRVQMFRSLVLPIMLYATEITGYDEQTAYDTVLRRYLRWTLGLGQGTRNAILERETGEPSVSLAAFSRAVNYENKLNGGSKISELLKEAHRTMTGGNRVDSWTTQRIRRLTALGMGNGSNEDAFSEFGIICRERLRLLRVRRAELKRIAWYYPPDRDRAKYLYEKNQEWRTIARFRCGAEFRGTHTWRVNKMCRLCEATEETPDHMATHDDGKRALRELLAEEGSGIDWMEKFKKS